MIPDDLAISFLRFATVRETSIIYYCGEVGNKKSKHVTIAGPFSSPDEAFNLLNDGLRGISLNRFDFSHHIFNTEIV